MIRRVANKAKRVGKAQSLRLISPPRRFVNKVKESKRIYEQSEEGRFYKDHPKLKKYYLRWRATISSPDGPLVIGLPWITFSAIDWLDRKINNRSRIFEWGSGGSTIFFTGKAGKVVSVEHDPTWFKDVSAALKQTGTDNYDYRLVKPEAAPRKKTWDKVPGKYRSVDPPNVKKHFHNYCAQIDEFPDGLFDVVIVDGRARSSCVYHAIPKVKPGGWILLDNSERKEYKPGIKAIQQWRRKDFWGPVPYLEAFNHTSVFQRPK